MQLRELAQYNPDPTSFPYDEGDIFATFKGYPYALTTKHILDLKLPPKDRELLNLATLTFPKVHLFSLLHYLSDNNKTPMPEPGRIEHIGEWLLYVFKHPYTQSNFGIQVRYWNYFRHRYPTCIFLFGRCEHASILVVNKHAKNKVGIIIPENFPDKML